VDPFLGRRALGGRKSIIAALQLFMSERSPYRVHTLGKNPFNPFIEEEAGAVDILVEHPDGKEIGKVGFVPHRNP
jgi:hypothetical protein